MILSRKNAWILNFGVVTGSKFDLVGDFENQS